MRTMVPLGAAEASAPGRNASINARASLNHHSTLVYTRVSARRTMRPVYRGPTKRADSLQFSKIGHPRMCGTQLASIA